MSERLTERTSAVLVANEKRGRRNAFLAVMGVAIALVVGYALTLPALSLSGSAYCGNEAHEHGPECYSSVLVCDVSTEATEPKIHSHTDSCYVIEQTLACDLSEGMSVSTAASAEDNGSSSTGEFSDVALSDGEKLLESDHVHNDACYEQVRKLVCGLEEGQAISGDADSGDAHVHGEVCYVQEISCGVEEHAHSISCYSNHDADVESAATWETTLPATDELKGVWADDLILVAKSQIGYTESDENYVVTEEGRLKGYSRYGAWYGDAYGDWCAMFVSFCLHYAGVPEELMPQDANCQNWIEVLNDEEDFGYYVEADCEFIPMTGDLVFFDWNADGVSDHVGIVFEYVAATEGAPAKVKTIEGNASDAVAECEYAFDDKQIMGYAMLPVNSTQTVQTLEEMAEEILPGEQYALEDGAYYFAAKDGDLPRFYQWSSYGIAYEVHTFVLIPSAELEDGEWEPSTKNWSGKEGANYVVAYCSDDRTTTSPSEPDLYSSYTIDNSRFASDEQQRKIAAIIGNSYPFLSASEARAVMAEAGVAGASEFSEHELTTAAQWAIWATVETVSHLEESDLCYIDIVEEGYSEENTVNPLTPASGLSDASKARIVAAKEWLCSLIEPIELEVSGYVPEITSNDDGTYNLTVTVSLNRGVVSEENACFSMTAGDKSTETASLATEESRFSISL